MFTRYLALDLLAAWRGPQRNEISSWPERTSPSSTARSASRRRSRSAETGLLPNRGGSWPCPGSLQHHWDRAGRAVGVNDQVHDAQHAIENRDRPILGALADLAEAPAAQRPRESFGTEPPEIQRKAGQTTC